MEKAEKQLGEIREFCRANGYALAAYEKTDNDNLFELLDKDCQFGSDLSDDMVVVCDKIGGQVDFDEFNSKDKKYVFLLHNTYNLSKFYSPKFM